MKITKEQLRQIIREEVRNATLQEGVAQDMEEQPESLQRLLSNMSGHRAQLADRIADLTQEVARLKDRVEAMQRDET